MQEWTKEKIEESFKELGFCCPRNSHELKLWNQEFKDYPYKSDPLKIDPKEILRSVLAAGN